jgi:hypothetical protein
MHTGLSTIQEMSQNRLNGMPKSIGSIRSHNETEKHIAANGISATSKALTDGLLMVTRLSQWQPNDYSLSQKWLVEDAPSGDACVTHTCRGAWQKSPQTHKALSA